MSRLIVLKFGGSVLTDAHRLRIAVHEIYRWRRDGWQVLAVVSALHGRTDALEADLHPHADPHARASYLASGEREAAALLGVHLDRAGLPATVYAPGEIAFLATGHPLDADPVDVDRARLRDALERDGVVVVPGFIAHDERGRTVTLGRGGSDLTAIFLAHALDADTCRLVKDVDGLYDDDPARTDARRYDVSTFDDALATDGSIVQHKAVRLAIACDRPFELGRCNGTRPTRIGHGPTAWGEPDRPRRLRVALLGHGCVGGGVLDLLKQLPESFEVTSVSVRNPQRHDLGDLATTSLHPDADVVVETIGGIEDACDAVTHAIREGRHVVTANKALLADRGPELRALASAHQVLLRAGASVGGSLPVIERTEATRPVRLRGVLNGTVNFILDALRDGERFDEALRAAQRLGFAERDPSRDLDGRDTMDKLLVLAQVLGTDQAIHACEPIDQQGDFTDRTVRQVATLDRTGLSVRFETIDEGDPLHDLPGAWNAVELHHADGTTDVIRGRGAGRWPTAEAVLADLLECSRCTSEVAHG